jgi:hypothetical protein
VRLDAGKAASFGFAKPSASPFGCQLSGCDQIPLTRTSPGRNIAPNQPGIRRMSGKAPEPGEYQPKKCGLAANYPESGECRIRREGHVMTKLLLGLASLPFIASMAMAGQPVALSDTQMDKVTAGNFTYTTQLISAGGISTNTYVIKTGNTTITYTELNPSFPIILLGPGF